MADPLQFMCIPAMKDYDQGDKGETIISAAIQGDKKKTILFK